VTGDYLVNFESNIAGIPTDDQDFAFTAQILCEQPTLRLCAEECLQVRETAFVNGAVVVAGVEKDLQFTFRHLHTRFETHQGIPDFPARNALTIPMVPVPRLRLMIHRLPPGVYFFLGRTTVFRAQPPQGRMRWHRWHRCHISCWWRLMSVSVLGMPVKSGAPQLEVAVPCGLIETHAFFAKSHCGDRIQGDLRYARASSVRASRDNAFFICFPPMRIGAASRSRVGS